MTILLDQKLIIKSALVFILFNFGLFKPVFGQDWAAYEEEIRIKVPGITDGSQIPALSQAQKQITRNYLDGFGRPIQQVAVGASPTGKDLIQPVTYNNAGQQTHNYLPYAGSDGSGNFRTTALTEQAAFYASGQSGKVAIDTYPYSQTFFENSPLQRVLLQGSVGDGFQLDQHSKSFIYRTNTSAETVLIWSADGISTGTYSPGTLSVTQSTDEQGVSLLIYKDNSDRVILQRKLINETINGVLETTLDTYWVYNDNGSVSFTIPPKAVVSMRNNANWNVDQTGISNLIFKYLYDAKGHVIQKTVPDGAVVYLVYDPLNRPVLVQDGNMRVENKWNYIKYDIKGRAISQGIYKDDVNIGQANMQNYVNGLNYTANYYERRNGTAINYGYYTNNSFPTINNVAAATPIQPLSYVYFDDYDLNQDGNPDYAYNSQSLPNESSASPYTRGMLTAISRTTIGAGVVANKWLYEVMFYDKQGRAIQTQGNNHTNTANTLTDVKTMVPDFTGKSLQDKVTKVIYNVTTTVLTSYGYDHSDRIKSIDQSYNGAATIRIAAYTYNEVGQMIYKQLHSKNTGATFLQSLDYRFNIRGQLLSINNSTLTAGSNNTLGTAAIFGMELLYDKVDTSPNSLNNTPYYNGLLSAVKWKIAGASAPERSYKYTYDSQNRLQDAVYTDRASGEGVWGNVGAYDEKGIRYDYNGNILTLERTAQVAGSIQNIDNLQYSYTGNKLNTVTDGTGSNYTALGFKNLTGGTGSYAYDTNGNITSDPYKGLSIDYNILNRTDKVNIVASAGRYINYTYDVSGVLIKKQQYDAGVLSRTTDYLDGIVYENSVLKYVNIPEGRAVNTGSDLKPEYFISDQQGNVRLSFQERGNTGLMQLRQENSYYPFGLIMPNSQVATPTNANRDLYNGGSEWQNDYGDLPDLYQTFYRNYDPALGRFTGVDPKAENSESFSPYHYAGNNPVMFNDPLGDDYNTDNMWTALRALLYSKDGGYMDSKGNVTFYTSQMDAVWNISDRMDRGIIRGGWAATPAGSFQAFYDNFYAGKLAGEFNNNSTSLREVNITETHANSLWLAERIEESQGSGGNEQGANKGSKDFEENNDGFNRDDVPVTGLSIIASGLPLIPKVLLKVLPRTLIRGFVPEGASALTSVSSIVFRIVIPSTWGRVGYLPKALSLGGQLGRVTAAAGIYITAGQLIWDGFKNFQTMSVSQQFNMVNYQMHSGAYIPDALRRK